MVETLGEKLNEGVGSVSGRASTNVFVMDGVMNDYLFYNNPKNAYWRIIFEKAFKKTYF